jgi:DNA-binding response OmpR family regulator
MPGLDGYDVIRFVRHSEDIAATKILVVSALNDQELKRAVEYGADAYLQKPYANSELLAAIEMLLDHKGAG